MSGKESNVKKLVLAAAAAVLCLGSLGTVSAQGTPAARSSARTSVAARAAAYTPPAIRWHGCSNPTLKYYGSQCGYLVVPMNYAHPNGAKIRIAVSRKLHTVPDADYQGVMLVNPGGPGGSGLIYSVLQGFVPKHAGDAYDWIGFDPRGVGSSRPSLSCDANFFHGDRPSYAPTTPGSHDRWVVRSRHYATQCLRSRASALFRHVKTVDSARDMDSLRKALGRKSINFYGFSYGTYLGSVYATLFPTRVRRFVFDSTVDPRKVFYRSNLDQDVAFQKTFNIYFSWLAKYHSIYHVGATRRTVRAHYLATVRRLDQHAVKGILGGDELIDVFTSAGYYVYGWESIAGAYSRFYNGGSANALIKMYQGANDTSPGGDNSYTMYLATQCTDARWPQSQAKLDRDSVRYNRTYNYFTWSNAWFNGPCTYWHYPASRPTRVTGRNVTSKVLMIDETYDAATPYAGSLYVRSVFPTASLIEGRNGTTHAGTLSGVACTDDAIADYLLTGATPARRAGNRSDKVCSPVPQPVPARAATAHRSTARTTASASALPTVIRRALMTAQSGR